MSKMLVLLAMFGTIVFSSPLPSEALRAGWGWGSDNTCSSSGTEDDLVCRGLPTLADQVVNGNHITLKAPLISPAEGILNISVCDDIDCDVLDRPEMKPRFEQGETDVTFDVTFINPDTGEPRFGGPEYDIRFNDEYKREGRKNVESVYLYVINEEENEIYATLEFQLFNCPDELVISNYSTTGTPSIEVTNVSSGWIIGRCSVVSFNVLTEGSNASTAFTFSGADAIASGETRTIELPGASSGPGVFGIYGSSSTPQNGTSFSTYNEITGMVYLNNDTVFGISHLTAPEYNDIYHCIYGGHCNGLFTRPFKPVSECLP